MDLAKIFSSFSPDLLSEIQEFGVIQKIPVNTEILREGQYVKVIPVVIEGLIKVSTHYQDRELLLYYIKPKESCVMSFSVSIKNEPSRVFATTEEETTALLLPLDKVTLWTQQFPDINSLFFQQFNVRYSELLDTINSLLYDRLDKRLLDYLNEKTTVTQKNPIKISHRQIATELGTSREVISRIIKKLEQEGIVKQHINTIELLAL